MGVFLIHTNSNKKQFLRLINFYNLAIKVIFLYYLNNYIMNILLNTEGGGGGDIKNQCKCIRQ